MCEYALIPENKKIDFMNDRLADLNISPILSLILFVPILIYGFSLIPKSPWLDVCLAVSCFIIANLLQMVDNKDVIFVILNILENKPVKINTKSLEYSCKKFQISTFEQLQPENNTTNPLHE